MRAPGEDSCAEGGFPRHRVCRAAVLGVRAPRTVGKVRCLRATTCTEHLCHESWNAPRPLASSVTSSLLFPSFHSLPTLPPSLLPSAAPQQLLKTIFKPASQCWRLCLCWETRGTNVIICFLTMRKERHSAVGRLFQDPLVSEQAPREVGRPARVGVGALSVHGRPCSLSSLSPANLPPTVPHSPQAHLTTLSSSSCISHGPNSTRGGGGGGGEYDTFCEDGLASQGELS